jgi:D-3-phosphoglycerate dehydrogenase
MYKIQTLNKISTIGLEIFPRDAYEVASEILNPDAILVRSATMLTMEIPASVKAIARAGAGVNNIPVPACSECGVVVFNTPGANANGVKELVIVVGLGAIGVMVANDAVEFGMKVTGFDPFISVEAAWGLSRNVKRARGLESLLAESDYITLHVPLNDQTKGMINKERIALMKKGARLLNFARGGLVNNADLREAMKEGTIAAYVTDFPDEEMLKADKVVAFPHLGASTPEAEDNCAVMAVNQLRDFLENGNIRNAVNYPDCDMGPAPAGGTRIILANKNVPAMVGQITTVLAAEKINISDMINKHRGDLAYNIIDIDGKVGDTILKKLKGIQGVIMVRAIA